MTESTVLSTAELFQLLEEGKIEEFNKLRPRSQQEFSERRDQDASQMFQGDKSFTDYVRDTARLPELLYLPGVDLSGKNLSGANLSGIDFSEAKLNGCNLTNAKLTNSDFHLADLSGAILHGADVWGADFWEANITDVDWTDVVYAGNAKFAEVVGVSEKQAEVILNHIKGTWNNNVNWK